MNEVEKMMQNANIKQDRMCEWTCKGNEFCSTNCEHYESTQVFYPPFTAEKQLSLIKWIAEYKEECRITYEKEYKWCTQTDWQSSFCYDNFPASLANLINNLWQDLTDTERTQIKEILE